MLIDNEVIMSKFFITTIAVLFAGTAFAFTANPVPFPPKRPTDLDALTKKWPPNYCPKSVEAEKHYCTKNSNPKVWLPPKEIQDKVAPVK